MTKNVDEMLEDAEELEVNENGEIVPKGHGQKPEGRGVKLKDHTFYA